MALPPSMFDGEFNQPAPVTEAITTVPPTTVEPTLGAINDPELVKFQKELDRRYFNLNKKEPEEVSSNRTSDDQTPFRIKCPDLQNF